MNLGGRSSHSIHQLVCQDRDASSSTTFLPFFFFSFPFFFLFFFPLSSLRNIHTKKTFLGINNGRHEVCRIQTQAFHTLCDGNNRLHPPRNIRRQSCLFSLHSRYQLQSVYIYISFSPVCACVFPLYTEPKERFAKSSKIFKNLQNLHSELVKKARRKKKRDFKMELNDSESSWSHNVNLSSDE